LAAGEELCECRAASAQVLPAPAQPCWQALLPVLSRRVRCAPLLAPPESAGACLAAPALLQLAVALFRRARTARRALRSRAARNFVSWLAQVPTISMTERSHCFACGSRHRTCT